MKRMNALCNILQLALGGAQSGSGPEQPELNTFPPAGYRAARQRLGTAAF